VRPKTSSERLARPQAAPVCERVRGGPAARVSRLELVCNAALLRGHPVQTRLATRGPSVLCPATCRPPQCLCAGSRLFAKSSGSRLLAQGPTECEGVWQRACRSCTRRSTRWAASRKAGGAGRAAARSSAQSPARSIACRARRVGTASLPRYPFALRGGRGRACAPPSREHSGTWSAASPCARHKFATCPADT